MSESTDYTKPGPAGLYFDLKRLTRNAHIAAIPGERTARQSLEHWCTTCGQSACFGYGVTLTSDGYWSCGDTDCRAQAEARATQPILPDCEPAAAEIARRDCPAPPAKPSKAEAALDLFGRAA